MDRRTLPLLLALAICPPAALSGQAVHGEHGSSEPPHTAGASPYAVAPIFHSPSHERPGAESPLDRRVATIAAAPRSRPWWLLPAIGAGTGGLGMGLAMARRDRACMDPIGCVVLAPLVGFVVGGAAGGVLELMVRLVEED